MKIEGPQIQLRSGRYFDLLNPDPALINISDIAHSLSNLCRFTGHVVEYFSVAQHSVFVSQIVPKEYALEGLLHDAAEAYVGDMASPLKALLPDYKTIECRVEEAIAKAFNIQIGLRCIKQADLVMLATERSELMPPSEDDWPCLEGIEPLTLYIQPQQPYDACRAFLDRYYQITKGRTE